MNQAVHEVRLEPLDVVATFGVIRDRMSDFHGSDVQYIERELASMQGSAHRLREFLEHIEQQRN